MADSGADTDGISDSGAGTDGISDEAVSISDSDPEKSANDNRTSSKKMQVTDGISDEAVSISDSDPEKPILVADGVEVNKIKKRKVSDHPDCPVGESANDNLSYCRTSTKKMQKMQPREGMYMSIDIFSEILSWLPAKDVFKFGCACKSWSILLGGAKFAKVHTSRSTRNEMAVAPKRHQFFFISNSTGEKLNQLNPPLPRTNPNTDMWFITGVLDGLMTLCKRQAGSDMRPIQYILNPCITGKKRLIPDLPEEYWSRYVEAFGFGCSAEGLYKLVIVLRDKKSLTHFGVYNIVGGDWELVPYMDMLKKQQQFLPPSLCLSGHIITIAESRRSKIPHVGCFCLGTNTFEDRDVPIIDGEGDLGSAYLAMMGSSICMVRTTTQGKGAVWTLDDFESWTWDKKYQYNIHTGPQYSIFWIFWNLTEDGDLLLTDMSKLLFYNLKTGKERVFDPTKKDVFASSQYTGTAWPFKRSILWF